MKTTILFIQTEPPTFALYRGSFEYLRKRGFDVHLCSSPGPFLRETAETEGAGYAEIPMKRGISPIHDIVTIINLHRHMRKLRPTIVVSSTTKAAVLGTVAAALCRVPVRVMVKWGVITEGRSPIAKAMFWCADKLASLCADFIVSCADSVTRELIRTKIARPENVYLMEFHLYARGEAEAGYTRTFAPSLRPLKDAMALRKKFGIPPSARVIGNVGRLTAFKGIPDLVEAYKNVLVASPETRLLVVGPHDAIDAVPESLDWLRNHDRVVLVGPQWNLMPFYAMMDLFVFPSYREGFGVVAVEAGAMGLPAVGYRSTGIVDSIEDGVTGTLVPVGDAAALAGAIVDYLEHPEKRFRHGIDSRRRVVQRFSPDRLFETYEHGYRDMLRRKGLPEPKCAEPPTESPTIDLETDEHRLRTWLAAKEYLRNGESLDRICEQLRIPPDAVTDLVRQLEKLEEPDVDRLLRGQAVGHFDRL